MHPHLGIAEDRRVGMSQFLPQRGGGCLPCLSLHQWIPLSSFLNQNRRLDSIVEVSLKGNKKRSGIIFSFTFVFV